jgi:anti-anti-sigma factor
MAMDDDYLSVRAERRGNLCVLKVRGGLDVFTADRFAAEAGKALHETPEPVLVDLSGLDYVDAKGARTLTAVARSVPRWRLAGMRGCQPRVCRVLDLAGLDLAELTGEGEIASGFRAFWADELMTRAHAARSESQELRTRARAARSGSQEVRLRASVVMARLAATCARLAASRQQRTGQGQNLAEQEREQAARLLTLSETARDLSARSHERAMSRAMSKAV